MSRKSFSFDKQLKVGDEGVSLLISHLTKVGHTVEDLTKGPNAQDRDIDLLVDGITVEVKSDSHKATNVFLELTCGNRPGCLFKSRADYWAIVFPKERIYYWVALPELQWWVSTHMANYKHLVIRSHRNKRLWKATGIAVPISDLFEAGLNITRYALGGE